MNESDNCYGCTCLSGYEMVAKGTIFNNLEGDA